MWISKKKFEKRLVEEHAKGREAVEAQTEGEAEFKKKLQAHTFHVSIARIVKAYRPEVFEHYVEESQRWRGTLHEEDDYISGSYYWNNDGTKYVGQTLLSYVGSSIHADFTKAEGFLDVEEVLKNLGLTKEEVRTTRAKK